MAFELNFTEPTYGDTRPASYWRVAGLGGVDIEASAAVVYLKGYVSKDLFLAGKQPFAQKDIPLQGADFAAFWKSLTTGGDAKKAIYDAVKAQTRDPMFATAKDV